MSIELALSATRLIVAAYAQIRRHHVVVIRSLAKVCMQLRMAEETGEPSTPPFELQRRGQNSDMFYDAVDWGWGESLKRRKSSGKKS